MDLASFSDAAESTLRFLAMLSGPFYPILQVIKERLVYPFDFSVSFMLATSLVPSINFQ